MKPEEFSLMTKTYFKALIVLGSIILMQCSGPSQTLKPATVIIVLFSFILIFSGCFVSLLKDETIEDWYRRRKFKQLKEVKP